MSSFDDKIVESVTPVISAYKGKIDNTLNNIANVLDSVNGDTEIVEAERIINEINGN